MKTVNRFALALFFVLLVLFMGIWIGGDPRLMPARAEAQQVQSPLVVILMTATPAPTASQTPIPSPTATSKPDLTASPTLTQPATPTKVPPAISPTPVMTQSTPSATQIGGTPGLPRTIKAEIDYIPHTNLVVRKAPYGIKTDQRVIAGQRYFVYLVRQLADGSSWACMDDVTDWQACSRWFAIRADIDGDSKIDAPYADPAPGPNGL